MSQNEQYDPKVLRKLQLAELEVFKDFIKICDENGLSYFLFAGCEIGVERHKGFIPWDDDIDLFMPRPDYERLAKIWNKKADIKKYVQISDPTLLSDGDLFKDPGTEFYKQILYSDENNVYSWIEQANKEHIIRATPRNTIKAGLLYTYGKLTEYEIQKIDTELNNIGRSDASMSSFKSDNSAKNDDYFVIESNGKKVFGKVTNDKVKKGIIYNYDTRKLEPIIYADKDATFLTNRDISSNF